MHANANSYRRILHATSLLGGVQVVQALLALLRGKCTAALLGPAGMGVYALFYSSSATLQKVSSLGLNLAVVKEVAACGDHPERLAGTMGAASRLVTATAVAGALICVLFSRLLSLSTFGDTGMTGDFILLGLAVGFSVAAAGKLSILQGAGEIRVISVASVAAGAIGLAAAVPLYYFLRENGIVAALTAFALSSYVCFSIGVRRRLPRVKNSFSWKHDAPLARRLLSLGAVLMAGDLFASLSTYLINIFMRSTSGDTAVGLYQAANSVTLQYAGIVFTVLATDFFPRLSKAASDNLRMREVVNRQTVIVAAVMAPAVVLLTLTAPWVIRLLLSGEYLSVTPLMRWMALGIFLKALMTPAGYISFAKGNRKLFFWLEGVGCNLLTLLLCCVFFRLWGLIGLGYAMIADNAICLAAYLLINRRLYAYRPDRETFRSMIVGSLFAAAGFATTFFGSFPAIAAGTAIFLLSILWAAILLRRRMREEDDGSI